MEQNKSKEKKWIGAGFLAAIAASLCCITPVLAVLGGLGGIASTFSFLEPLRPYLIGLTVLVLGFAFYKAYKPRKKEDIECACLPAEALAKAGEEDEKKSFLNSKAFLWVVTGLSVIMFTFPSYSNIFFPDTNKVVVSNKNNITEAALQIEGMTCTSCEHSIDYSLKTTKGVLNATSSYKTGIAKVKYDKSKVSSEQLKKAVEEKSGYKVKGVKKLSE